MNYKNLRRRLRNRYGLSKMNEHYEHVLAELIARRLKNSEPEKLKLINAMIALLEEFHDSSVRTLQSSIERIILIEKQIERKEFNGALHDEYHTASKQFKINYHALVRNAKNIANITARYIEINLVHTEKRGLRFDSFGKLYKSIKTYEPLDPKQRKIKKAVEEFGAQSEETVHEYRDTVLEHFDPTRPTDHQNIETKDDRTILRKAIMGEVLNRGIAPIPPTSFDESRGNVVYDEVTDKEGNKQGYRYHLHRYMRDNISEGDQISHMGQIMVPTDFGDGHFDKHGLHGHTFSSYDYPGVEHEQSIHLDMPGFSQLTFLYISFIEYVLEIFDDEMENKELKVLDIT